MYLYVFKLNFYHAEAYAYNVNKYTAARINSNTKVNKKIGYPERNIRLFILAANKNSHR